MAFSKSIVSGLRSLFHRQQVSEELDDEINSYLAIAVEEKVRAGMSREQAVRAARMQMGNMEVMKDQIHGSGWESVVETFAQDLRFGLRTFAKNPGFTTVAVLTLALGIAANATIFSVVSAIMLKPPPIPEAARVMVVYGIDPIGGYGPNLNPISAPNFLAWKSDNRSFTEMAAAQRYGSVSLSSMAGLPERVSSIRVTANFFSLLGVQPLIGRTFVTNEDNGSERVVVLSHELWTQRFASDGGIVGRSIALDGEPHTVIGVMPPQFVLRTFHAQLWTPLPLNAIGEGKAARENRFLTVLGRLRPGITQKQAAAQISGLAKRAEQDFSQTEKGWGASALTMQEYQTKDLNAGPGMVILMSAVACVLMIACANVAGLLLARATARRKEIGLRLALGARRGRIVLQLMTESLLLAALGGIAGIVLAYWGANLVRSHMASQPELRVLNVGIDGNVLLLTAGLSVCTAFLFGLVPALQAARSDVQSALKAGGLNASSGRSSNHLRGALVIGQFALAVVLLSGTGLLLKAIYNQMHGDLGFDSHRLLTAQISIPEKYYKTPVSRSAFYTQLLQRTSVLPEVEGTAITSNLPAAGAPELDVSFKGQEDLPPSQRGRSRYFVVDPAYLRTLSITLLRGRGFLQSDQADSPKVSVVNEVFAHKFFPGGDAIGKVVRIDIGNEGKQDWREIVGVVGNVKNWPLQTTNDPEIYESYLQRPPSSMFIALRTSGDPDQLIVPLRQTVFSIDKMLPVSNAQSMTKLMDDETGMDRFLTSLLATFAGAAIVLAGIGIYGVVAYTVGQRTREIGIRVALGAGRASVRRLVMIAGMKLGALGAGIGLLLSLPLPRAFAGMLMDFRVRSGPVFVVVPMIIVATALLACYIPTRRAVRVNPTVALRCE